MTTNAPHNAEVDAILAKIGGVEIKNVLPNERWFAVERAVRMVGVTARTEVNALIDIIETNEAQLAVHSEPSDPDDID